MLKADMDLFPYRLFCIESGHLAVKTKASLVQREVARRSCDGGIVKN